MDKLETLEGVLSGAALAAAAGFAREGDETQRKIRIARDDSTRALREIEDLNTRGEIVRSRMPVVMDFDAGLSVANQPNPVPSVTPSTAGVGRPDLAVNMSTAIAHLKWPPKPGQYDERGNIIIVGELTALASALTINGDYLAISLLQSKELLGVYFFGYQLSLALVALVTSSLDTVMMPTFSALGGEPSRQTELFMRGIRLLAVASTFACFGLALAAPALIHGLWAGKWDEAIPVVQILSLAMPVRLMIPLCRAMLERARQVGVRPRIDDHQEILLALKERNPTSARNAMREHLGRVIDNLLTATEIDALERARNEVAARRTELARRSAI